MIDAFLNILRRAAAYLAAFFSGRLYEQKEQAEDDRDAMEREAQRHANAASANTDDVVRLLRERAGRKRQARTNTRK